MGNTLDSAPVTYSSSDPTQIHKDEWLQTYRQDPQANTDKIPWGHHGGVLNIGAKVLQDVNNNQLYVRNPQGQKIYITQNGKQRANASQLIKQAVNYGNGPMVEIIGSPTDPEYYLWSADQWSGGNKYQAVKINNMQDLEYAMTRKTDGSYTDGTHSGQYGEASISGPFQDKPRDFWTGVADAERIVGNVGMSLIVPIVADVIGTVIPGFSAVTQGLGLQDDLSNAIANAQAAHMKAMQHKSGSQFDTNMASVITDPRLTDYYNQSFSGYSNISKETENHDPSLLQMPSVTPQQRLLKARAMQASATNMQAAESETQLSSLIAQLKVKYPKQLDWDYFDQMTTGLKIANNSTEKLNVLDAFAGKLVSAVQGIQSQARIKEETTEQEAPAITTQPHTRFWSNPDGTTTSVPPKGAGFGPLSWNPLVINGTYTHGPQQVLIRG